MIPTILFITPSVQVKGGISTVIRNLLSSDLKNHYDFFIIASHVDGTKTRKLLQFIFAFVQTIFVLSTKKIDIIYIHGSDIISSSRK